jgi:hypothetical protein
MLLSNWFEAKGWSVKRGVYGIKTAFEARFSIREGGRIVCFNAEYGMFKIPQRRSCTHATSY